MRKPYEFIDSWLYDLSTIYILCFSDSKETFVLEIDDETDEDLMSVLLEQELPEVMLLITIGDKADFLTDTCDWVLN